MAIKEDNVTPEELPAIQESAEWVEHLPALLTGVKVRGGDNGEGAANFQGRVLDARVRWLKQVVEGLATGGIILIGELPDEDTLNEVDTQGLQVGTAYFVNFALRVWNGTAWGTSGSLRGERGLNLLGVWPEIVPLPEVEENEIGDAYIWNHDFWVLVPNPLRWEAMGIRGPEGASAYEIWEKKDANKGKTEDQYLKSLIGKDSYEIAVDQGYKGTRAEWVESLRAKNNYELWLQTGKKGSLEDYLATLQSTTPGPKGDSIKGDTGDPGKDGRNLNIIGTVPTRGWLDGIADKKDQDAYIVSENNHLWMYLPPAGWTDLGPFKGTDGKDGKNGRNITLLGAVETIADLPKTPTDQDCYAVTAVNAVYMYITSLGWTNLGTFKGADGKDGTLGKDGTNGKDGKDGKNGINIVITGAVDTFNDLPKQPVEQDVYAVRDENRLYGRIGGSWVSLGAFKGEKGEEGKQGEPGESIKGDPGKDGKDGRNIVVKNSLPTVDYLPTSNNQEQDCYAINDSNEVWMWIEGVWKLLGKFKGRDGVDGVSIILKGAVSTFNDLPKEPEDRDVYSVRAENAIYAWVSGAWLNLGSFKGEDGKDGKNGTNGKDGKDGVNGKATDIIKVLTEEDQTLPPLDETTLGKSYLDLDRIVWINIEMEWKKVGPIGEPGKTGPAGPPMKIRGTVPTQADLPDLASTAEGDLWYVADTKLAYGVVDGEWTDPIDMIGPEGKQGLEGLPGALMPILGLYPTLAALKAEHPTGEKGDAYLVVTGQDSRNLIVWNSNTNQWQDTGPAGLPGPRGASGKDSTVPGPRGEKGSQWLILPEDQDEPSDTFNGRPGDWAVTKNMRVWYKTATGWIFWNYLAAGDVNSPLRSEGVVARLGPDWVPLPVDEVKDPAAGKVYGRRQKADDEEATEWVEIEFPDVLVKDGKQYCRIWLEGEDTPTWQVIEFPEGMKDLTGKDGKQYARTWAVDGAAPIWKEIEFPKGIVDLVTKDDTKQFVRVFKNGADAPVWQELKLPAAGIGDVQNPEAGELYLRDPSNSTWVKYAKSPSDGRQYVQKNGAWVRFDRYDLAIKTITATYTVDPEVEQIIALDNTTATAKVLSIKDFVGTRATTVVIRIKGLTGVISYGGTNIRWDTRLNNGSPPELNAYRTTLVFFWDGEVWTGNVCTTTNQ